MISIAALVLIAGLLMLAIGVRGWRINDHPICRSCRFDLVGIHGRAPRCPECGGELTRPRAVRIGRRKVHRSRTALGAALVLVGIVAGGVTLWASATGVDWNTYKPEWWLAADAQGGSSRAEGAIRELTKRLDDGALSMPLAQELIATGLERQMDEEIPWLDAWAIFLETARVNNMLSDAQLQQYIQAVADISFHMRARAAQAMPWDMRIGLTPGRIVSNALQLQIATTGLWIDDQPIDIRTMHIVTTGPGGVSTIDFNYNALRLRTLPPGEYDARLGVRITVTEANAPAIVVGTLDAEFSRKVQIVGPGEPLVELMTGEQLRSSVFESIAIRSTSISEDGHLAEGFIEVREAPVDMLFDIIWRFDDETAPDGYQELRMGGIAVKQGRNGGTKYSRSMGNAVRIQRTDIILRPAIGIAGTRMDFDRLWAEEIEFPDLLLSPLERESS